MQCPNVCAERNRVFQHEQARAKKIHDEGAKKRAQYIAKARADREKEAVEVAQLKEKLLTAESEEARLKLALDEAERADSRYKAQVQSSRTSGCLPH